HPDILANVAVGREFYRQRTPTLDHGADRALLEAIVNGIWACHANTWEAAPCEPEFIRSIIGRALLEHYTWGVLITRDLPFETLQPLADPYKQGPKVTVCVGNVQLPWREDGT